MGTCDLDNGGVDAEVGPHPPQQLANQRAIACGDKLQDWTAQQGLGVCAYHCVRCARRRDNDAFVTHLDQQIGGSEREGDVAIAFQPQVPDGLFRDFAGHGA
jgi:hypothetical protein